jgi:hypothetical protein
MPTGLSVDPARQAHNPAVIHVKDIGTTPVHVTTSTWILHAHCTMTSVGGVSVSPASFALSPGQSVTVHAGTPGQAQDYGVLFSAIAKGAHGQVVSSAVGSQILTRGATSCTHPKALPVPASHSLFNPMGAVILAVVVLGLALATWATVLKRRRDRRQPSREYTS